VIFNQRSKKIITREATGFFLVKVAGAALLFFLHLILVKLLGIEQYGIYVYAWNWMNILLVVSLLGFHVSLIRFIAEYNIKRQWGLLWGVLKRSQQFALGTSIFISIAGVTVFWIFSGQISKSIEITFYIAFFALPVFTFIRLRESSLIAFKKVIRSGFLLQIIHPALTIIFVFILLFLIKEKLNAPYAMTANFIAASLTAAAGAFFLSKFLPDKIYKNGFRFHNKKWIKVSLPLLLVAVTHIVSKRVDIIILGVLKGFESAGIYAVVSNISNLVIFACFAVNVVLAPLVSELYYTGQKKDLQNISKFAARVIFVFTLITGLVLIILGKFVLGLFGLAFVAAYQPLLIVLCGQIIISLIGPVGLIMSMGGKQNMMGLIMSVSVAVSILLNIVLIPLFGLNGAAISTVVTMLGWNLAMLFYVQNKVGINPTII
jgi:O-antigen/teichoic acid export membrane protein